ncbi:hypothetical protein Hanom_Chr14g01268111 [Helianthus anomalus]
MPPFSLNCFQFLYFGGGIHVTGIRDLARYAMSSCCVGEMMSSKLRDCDFCLEESQVLNCVHFMFVVVSYEQGFYYVVL